jgi:hypothetical protein
VLIMALHAIWFDAGVVPELSYFTVIVTLSSADPNPRMPLTVKTWVAVAVGVRVCMPTGITIVPSRNTLLELVAVQDSVTDSPLVIVLREVERKAVGVGVEESPPHIRRGMHNTIRNRTDVGRMLNTSPDAPISASYGSL